jgi:DNA-binding transcriptional MocR family regulator
LNLMTDVLCQAMISGLSGSPAPWAKLPRVKFLCPSPGYDRHFAILEYLNIEMITIDLNNDGPDMDAVEKLAAEDDSIKGVFCVPKYSNPTGTTYSDAVVDRLARMKTKAPDFTIMWDNAYTAHHLSNIPDRLKNLLAACKESGNPERVLIFGSTSKVTLAGAGIAMIGGSKKNMDVLRKQFTIQTIGSDKMNQLRHCRFFRSLADIEAHMKKHAAIIKPKFDAVLEVLDKERRLLHQRRYAG